MMDSDRCGWMDGWIWMYRYRWIGYGWMMDSYGWMDR